MRALCAGQTDKVTPSAPDRAKKIEEGFKVKYGISPTFIETRYSVSAYRVICILTTKHLNLKNSVTQDWMGREKSMSNIKYV